MRGLDYSQERYVRLHTRDTPEWLALSWQARGVFALVTRAVDRAGRLPVGKLGLRGVAVALHAPWDEVRPALEELQTDGWIVVEDGCLLVPEHVEREETAAAGSQRMRVFRERRDAGVSPSLPVTPRNGASPAVTSGDVLCPSAVPSVPCLPSQREIARDGAREDHAARVNPPTDRQLEYQRAYERGIEAGKRGPYALDARQRGELHLAIEKYAREPANGHKGPVALRGERLLATLERMATAFAEDIVERARGDPKVIEVHSAFHPRGFLRWLSASSVGMAEKSGGL